MTRQAGQLASCRRSRISRREILRVGLGGATGLALPDLLQARRKSEKEPGTAVILVWLHGGASHLETYDPKPEAASDFRGPFGAISTNVPGLRVSELLPHHARVADRFVLLRSLVHTGFCHQQGTQQLLTGHPERVLRNKPLYPDLFSVVHRLRYDPTRSMPNYVSVFPVSYGGAAFLGSGYEPFVITDDPNSATFHVPNIGVPDAAARDRLDRRIRLRAALDRYDRRSETAHEMEALDTYESMAVQMLTGTDAREAFDITREDDATRDRYGRHRWGQQMLLARRLVEAGVDLVTTQLSGDLCGGVGNWDDHAVNANAFDAMKYRCQFFDQPLAALIEDLYERGLDQRVLLVVTGEFGRTPRINYQASTGKRIGSAPAGTVQPGRDHWPRATSVLFSGGGMETGRVVGATDARGEDAVDRIVGRGDFMATIYRHLGVDYERHELLDFAGRPTPLLQTPGKPIEELIG